MRNEVRNWRGGVRLSMMQGESASEISQEEVEIILERRVL